MYAQYVFPSSFFLFSDKLSAIVEQFCINKQQISLKIKM